MDIEEFEQRKMEYVKKEAGLTQEEAAKYFPLSRELTRKRLELNRNHRQKVAELREREGGMTDEDYRRLLESETEFRRKQAALEQQYNEKFRQVLSYEKLYNVQRAERSFLQREWANFRANREREEEEQESEE
jgi:hypothetical protein